MNIHWIPLESEEQLQQIRNESASEPVMIYKHSSRCSVSSMVLNRMERSSAIFKNFRVYFLDLLTFRRVSNRIEETFSVPHESPQLLVIRDAKVVLNLSHFEIEPELIERRLAKS